MGAPMMMERLRMERNKRMEMIRARKSSRTKEL
jgi:hypothetical protein